MPFLLLGQTFKHSYIPSLGYIPVWRSIKILQSLFFPKLRGNILPAYLFMSLATVMARSSTFTNVFSSFQPVSSKNGMLNKPHGFYPLPHVSTQLSPWCTAFGLSAASWRSSSLNLSPPFTNPPSFYFSSLLLTTSPFPPFQTLTFPVNFYPTSPSLYIQVLVKYCSDTVGVLVCCVCSGSFNITKNSSLKS